MNNKASSEDNIRSAIISLLFINGDPLVVKKIAGIIGSEEELIEEKLKDLVTNQPLEGLKIIQLENQYQLVSDPKNAAVVKKVIKKEEDETLGPGSLEVLSVIIYQGPITKGEIELIRGINSSQAIRNLMIKGLIEEQVVGGVTKYAPAVQLLKSLGVTTIEEVPDYSAIRNDKRIKNFLNRAINDSVDDGQE